MPGSERLHRGRVTAAAVFAVLGLAAWIGAGSPGAGGMAAAASLGVCFLFLFKWRSGVGVLVAASVACLAAIVVLWMGAWDEQTWVLKDLGWLVLPPALGWCVAAGVAVLEVAAGGKSTGKGAG